MGIEAERRHSIEPSLYAMLLQQNCENARHIKSERIWFMNTYSVITAGVLSLMHTMQSQKVIELALLTFMCFFSVIGLLTSFRLKAELEECLGKIRYIAQNADALPFVALGESEGALARYPKFRWIFPIFYSIATAAFVALLAFRLATGKAAW
jgi:hypothetical protein